MKCTLKPISTSLLLLAIFQQQNDRVISANMHLEGGSSRIWSPKVGPRWRHLAIGPTSFGWKAPSLKIDRMSQSRMYVQPFRTILQFALSLRTPSTQLCFTFSGFPITICKNSHISHSFKKAAFSYYNAKVVTYYTFKKISFSVTICKSSHILHIFQISCYVTICKSRHCVRCPQFEDCLFGWFLYPSFWWFLI